MNKPLMIASGSGRSYDCAPNEKMAYLVAAADTAGQIDFVEGEFGYLGGPPLHVHPQQDEIHYILQGQLRYQIGEQTIDVQPGDCIYIPRGTQHTWINLYQQPAKVLGVLTPGGSEGFFQTVTTAESMTMDALMKLGQDYGTEVVGPPLAAALSETQTV